MSVTHAKVSAKGDGTDATLVRPSDWNASHVIGNGTITAAMLASGVTNPPYTTYLAPGGPNTDLQTAVDSMPSAGGIIQLGAGTYTINSLISQTPDRAILIQGVGSDTAGADAPTVIQYTGTGSGSIIQMPLTSSNGFKDLEIKYTNTAFTGTLLSLRTGSAVGADTAQFYMDNVIMWGSHAAGQTATLLDVGQTIDIQFNRCDFNGGGYGVRGGRHVAVTGISVANPSIITAPAHGFTNGVSVRFGGMTTTPQLGTGATSYVITVIDANTFSIPINVTNVAVATGFVNSIITDTENANQIKFSNCQWRNQVIAGVIDPQQSWLFDTCLLEIQYNGDPWQMIHTPGNWASAVTFLNCWAGDQTTTNTISYIKWAGQGLNILGCRWGGRQVANITVLTLDDNNCDGYVISGNMATSLTHWIDFGTTTGHKHGVFQGNGSIGNAPGFSVLNGTIPKGIAIYDGAGSSTIDKYDLTGGATSSVLRFDADTGAELYRNASASLFMTGTLGMAGDINIAQGQQTGLGTSRSATQVLLNSQGSAGNIDFLPSSKGTGILTLNWNGGPVQSSGPHVFTKAVGYTNIISPTQLVANTSNWAPTGLATAYLVRLNVNGAITLDGIVAPVAPILGQNFWLYNTTAFTVTLVHDLTSTAANRFFCPNKANYLLLQGASAQFIYSATDSRWLVLAGGA